MMPRVTPQMLKNKSRKQNFEDGANNMQLDKDILEDAT